MRRALLVTGLPRTGTSWVGKMLEAGGRHVYINEPMNPSHPPGRSPGVLDADVTHYFQYISNDDDARWRRAFARTLALRYGLAPELRRNHRPYDLAKAARNSVSFAVGRMRGRSALVDDPYALFAVPWLVDNFDVAVVVTVREPVAFVGSWKKLGWSVDTAELLAQPKLVRDLLRDHRASLEEVSGDASWLDATAQLWNAAYAAVHSYADHPRVRLVRHEMLARQPLEQFRSLYEDLGIEWTARSRERVRAATGGGGNRPDGAFRWSLSGGFSRTAYRPMRSSDVLGTYRDRLSEQEIARVRELTDDVRSLFYGE